MSRDTNTIITSLNVNGLGDYMKQRRVGLLTKTASIVCLQETYATADKVNDIKARLGKANAVWSQGTGRARGSGVLWNDLKPSGIVMGCVDNNGRVAGAICHTAQGTPLTVISAYLPPVKNEKTYQVELRATLEEINKTKAKLSSHSKGCIIIGDLNIMLDPLRDGDAKGTNKTHKIGAGIIREWMKNMSLSDAYRHIYPNGKAYSYARGGENKHQVYRRLDYALATPGTLRWIQEVKYEYTPCSDHKALIVTLNEEKVKAPGRGLWRHNDKHLESQDYVETIKRAARESAEEAEGMDPIAKWEFIKFRIGTTSREWSAKAARAERAEKCKAIKTLEDEELRDPGSAKAEEARSSLKGIIEEEEKRVMFRSKTQWIENNEKCTKYFYRRIEENRKASNVTALRDKEGNITRDQTKIKTMLQDYYSDLYKKQTGTCKIDHSFTPGKLELTEEQRSQLDKPIKKMEVITVLNNMKKNKAPGCDGLTPSLYVTIWPAIHKEFTEALNWIEVSGEMSTSPRRSIIRLIEKKNKDNTEIKNWRPISLLNVDTKVYSSILANRIKPLLDSCISQNQKAFVKGRDIMDNVRNIQAIARTIKRNNLKAGIVAVDFAKAFDTIDHEYLWSILQGMGWPNNLINKIKALYKNAESAIINEGSTSDYFKIGRSCRQGDCLSPYLFIMAIDPLLRKLEREEGIEGVKLEGDTYKLGAFADDLTLIIRSKKELDTINIILDDFHETAGLQVNKDKTEMVLNKIEYQGQMKKQLTITVTGIPISIRQDSGSIRKAYLEKLAKVKSMAKNWLNRDLSLIGRGLLIKSKMLSQFVYLNRALIAPDDIIRDTAKIIYNFLWKGPDRVPRERAAKVVQEGGLNMPEIRRIFLAPLLLKLQTAFGNKDNTETAEFWVKELNGEVESHFGNWEHLCRPVPLVRKKMKWGEPLQGILEAIYHFKGAPTLGDRVVPNSSLRTTWGQWEKHKLLRKLTIIDLIDPETLKWRPVTLSNYKSLPSKDFKVLRDKVNELGKKGNDYSLLLAEYSRGDRENIPLEGTPYLNINGKLWPLSHITKNVLKFSKDKGSNAMKHHAQKLGVDTEQCAKRIFEMARSTMEPRRKSHCWMFGNGLTYTNRDYKRMGFKDSEGCTYCKHESQTWTHLHMECHKVLKFKNNLLKGLREGLTTTETIIGTTDLTTNFILAEINWYIHFANHRGDALISKELMGIIKSREPVERDIAARGGKSKLLKHGNKWEIVNRWITGNMTNLSSVKCFQKPVTAVSNA